MYEILLIVDEVICGFGCIGNMWGFDIYLICFDIMIIVKGLFFGYVLIGGFIFFDEVFEVMVVDEFYYGYIYFGYLMFCVVVLENLCIFEEEDLIG